MAKSCPGRDAERSATETATSTSNERNWHIGTARDVITPEHSLWLGGLSAREEPAEGTEDDLHARAIALDDGQGSLLVVVNVELLYVSRELRTWLEEKCQSVHQLPPESLVVTATHTHCGPEYIDWRAKMYGVSSELIQRASEYTEQLKHRLFDLIDRALAERMPATLEYNHTRCGFSMNRRLPTPDGMEFAPNPAGPVDPAVPVLRATVDGTLTAVLFGYACHPVTASANRYSGDWPGHAQRYIEAYYPNTTALFLQGCAGDQHVYPNGSIELAKQHGRTMANAVKAVLEADAATISGPLQLAYEQPEVRFERTIGRDEILGWRDSENEYEQRRAELLLERLEREEGPGRTHPYSIQTIGFGSDLTIVALAGEPVVGYSLRLKRETVGPTWVVGYANDGFSYVPTARVLFEGGYEACKLAGTEYKGPIQHFRFPSHFHPSIEEQIISTVHSML